MKRNICLFKYNREKLTVGGMTAFDYCLTIKNGKEVRL